MQLIGLLGGMSWESTAEYYRIANELVRDRCGGLHSARCLTYSVDFAPVERMQADGRWDEAAEALCLAGRTLEAAGADFLVLCTNTMHKVADAVTAAVDIPLLRPRVSAGLIRFRRWWAVRRHKKKPARPSR